MTDHSAVKPTPCISAKILELEQLDSPGLSKLISGQVLAIRVPDFANEKTSARLIHSISETATLEQYSHETYEGGHVVQHFYGVHRWGTPFNSTYGKAAGSEAQRKYYADAAHMRSLIDRICAPQQPPIQALMQQLQAIWPQGAVAAAFQGQPMFCGIIRAMFPDTAHLSETVPHVDCLPRSVAELEQQLSANIYLQTPPSGGELIIWDTPAFAYDEVKRFEGAQLPEQRLQTPLRIRPRKNELVIINTRRPHAICGFDSGTRISMQSFIGYIPGEPFYFWC